MLLPVGNGDDAGLCMGGARPAQAGLA
jgi:hypothetical protein